MTLATTLVIAAVVMTLCVMFNRVSAKLGVPMLLAFMLLGMVFGSDGVVRIAFDHYELAEKVCSMALIFIMFYGGFGTKWSEARPVAVKALLLSSVGTVLTAGLTGLFCRYVLGMEPGESFLIGAVISSTDAASVFSILRSRKLNLRDHTASLLEVESGSNDPFSYMLTVIVLSFMNGGNTQGIGLMLLSQIGWGVVFGFVVAWAAGAFMRRFRFASEGFDAIFMVAVALFAYALPALCGGNGYLSVYIAGIVLGNRPLHNKQSLVHFFDGVTGMMQMLLFFLLGLLSFPSQLPGIALTALAVALFLTFIARPAAVFLLLSPFRSSPRQMLLVSWSGMRGAASIVFAMMAVINPAVMQHDIFHITFFIVLVSILLQGSLIPLVARKLKMTTPDENVMKTFTDYVDTVPVQFIRFALPEHHPWCNHTVGEVTLPPDCLLVLLLRGKERIVPSGRTQLKAGDVLMLSGMAMGAIDGVSLCEKWLTAGDAWVGKTLAELSGEGKLIMMIRRGSGVVIPQGATRLKAGDLLVMNEGDGGMINEGEGKLSPDDTLPIS